MVAALTLSACAATHPASTQPAGSDLLIPWKALPADLAAPPVPSPHGVPVPPGTPACKAGDLLAGVIGSNGAGGHVLTSFAFATSATAACFLDGMPAVTLLDSSGRDLGFAQRAAFAPAVVSGPVLVNPGPKPEEHQGLKFGEAGLTIDWVSQPEPCPGQNGSTIAAARIQLPTGGSDSVSIPQEPAGYACAGVGVSSFEGPAAEVAAPQPPALPSIAVNAPSSAKAGHRFEYIVTLTNDTQAPMDLAAICPNYEEELITTGGFPLGGKHFYKLNCAPAGTLATGKSAKFQMLLDIPANTDSGDYRLVFMLGFWNAMTRISPEHTVHIG